MYDRSSKHNIWQGRAFLKHGVSFRGVVGQRLCGGATKFFIALQQCTGDSLERFLRPNRYECQTGCPPDRAHRGLQNFLQRVYSFCVTHRTTPQGSKRKKVERSCPQKLAEQGGCACIAAGDKSSHCLTTQAKRLPFCLKNGQQGGEDF